MRPIFANRFAVLQRHPGLTVLVLALLLSSVGPWGFVLSAQAPLPEPGPSLRIAEKIAAIIGNEQIFRTTPTTVQKQFQALVELRPAKLTDSLWTFQGANPDLGVQWAQAEFQAVAPGADRPWELIQILLGVAPSDGDFAGLYQALEQALAEQLDKPMNAAMKNQLWGMWVVAPYREIWLREGNFDNPVAGSAQRVVRIRVAILQEKDR